MEEKQTVRIHRVGTVTFGCMLILFGVLFLVQLLVPALNYTVIFHLWPCIFIFLGLEVLAGNRKVSKENSEENGKAVHFVYDKAAIVLMICLSFFAMIMAMADYGLRFGEFYIR